MNEKLKLENQLCFPLYLAAKEVIRRYTPLLSPYGMTYTQYIAMMAMWEHRCLSVGELGKMLSLDSGTITPMIKKMEHNGWVRRVRSEEDERKVMVELTDAGNKLHDEMYDVPERMGAYLTIDSKEAMELYRLLYLLLGSFNDDK